MIGAVVDPVATIDSMMEGAFSDENRKRMVSEAPNRTKDHETRAIDAVAAARSLFTDLEKILKLEQLSTRVSGLEKDLTIWKWVAGITVGVALSALGLAVTALLGS